MGQLHNSIICYRAKAIVHFRWVLKIIYKTVITASTLVCILRKKSKTNLILSTMIKNIHFKKKIVQLHKPPKYLEPLVFTKTAIGSVTVMLLVSLAALFKK